MKLGTRASSSDAYLVVLRNARRYKARIRFASLATLLAIVAFLLGTAVGRYRIFPYQALAAVKHAVLGVDSVDVTINSAYLDRVSLFAETGEHADTVIYGDSILARGEWIDLARNSSISNRAIDGDTSDGLRTRLNDVLRLDPDTVHLMVGINDFLIDRSVDEVYQNYEALLEAFEKAGIFVVVQATLRTGTQYAKFHEANKKIDELNRRLARAASDRGFAFFDVNRVLATRGILEDAFTDDGIHPNARGYICWTRALRLAGENHWEVSRASAQSPDDCLRSPSTYAVVSQE